MKKVSVLLIFLALYQITPAMAQSRLAVVQVDVSTYSRGLSLAVERGAVKRGSALHQAIETFITQLSTGSTLAEATKHSGLMAGTIKRLYRMGQAAPIGYHQSAPTIPVPPPPERLSSPAPAPTQETGPNPLQAKVADLERKVSHLENKVEDIDIQVAQLSTQQQQFLAKLEALDDQQQEFLASIDRIIPTAPIAAVQVVPQFETIPTSQAETFTVEPVPKPEEIPPAQPKVVQPNNTDLKQHDIANALVAGLITGDRNGQIKYHSGMYFRVQSAIRLVRRGKPLKQAIVNSRVPTSVASQLLKWGGVNPNVVL